MFLLRHSGHSILNNSNKPYWEYILKQNLKNFHFFQIFLIISWIIAGRYCAFSQEVFVIERATKISQLIGDFDREHNQPTQNQTGTLYDIDYADLGIPFRHNAITRVVNPLKLYEYAAAGLPVVATWTEELQHHSEIVSLARNADEFHQLITNALSEKETEIKLALKMFARQNTWRHRVQALTERIHQHSEGVQ